MPTDDRGGSRRGVLVDRNGARADGVAPVLASTTLFFVLLGGFVALDRLPALVLVGYAVLSTVAFIAYRADKAAAVQGRRRTPESTLHVIDLLGGWPGALVARQVFRHKTLKQPFRFVFWLTVGANCLTLAWFVIADPLGLLE